MTTEHASKLPDSTAIPLETWRELYLAADSFWAAQLWNHFSDVSFLGLDDPRTGEPVLSTVLGANQEVFGIVAYPGAIGTRWILGVALNGSEMDIAGLLETEYCKVEFVPKRELSAEEKRRVKALDFLPTGGRLALWPTFVSQQPGYMPTPLAAEDAPFLLHALPRLTALGLALRPHVERAPHGDGRIPFWPKGHAVDTPVQLAEVEWRHVPMPPAPPPEIVSLPDPSVASLNALPLQPTVVLEFDVFIGMPIQGEDGRGYVAKMALSAESKSGYLACALIGSSATESHEMLAGRGLVASLENMRIRPGKIHVSKPRLAFALATLAQKLQIKIVLRRNLPAIEEARISMPGLFDFAR